MAIEKLYIPPPLLELRREVANHPSLLTALAVSQDSGLEGQLATIATYCDVVVDGIYTPDEVMALVDILIAKLQRKRMLVIH